VATTESSSREAAHRSLSLLEQFLNQKSDAALSSASEKALDQIATTKKNWVGQRASQSLLQFNLTNQAGLLQKLTSLGAEVEYDEEAPYAGIHVTIQSKNWQGKPADLQLIKKLPNLAHLKIFGPVVGDDDVPVLGSLAAADFIDLFGTKISDAGFQSLRVALPQVAIDRRKGGMLGIQGDPFFAEGCRIVSVQEKSAAAEAGIMADDIIKKIDGKVVMNFKDLTAIISEKGAGEKAKLEILRGEERITREPSLSAWNPNQTPNTAKSSFQGNIILQQQGGQIILGK
jgi:membrane-associated protease RseP (regulator of RpoE activity)